MIIKKIHYICIRRGYRYSSVKFFLSQSSQKTRRKSFCVSKKFWYRNFSCRGGGITVLSVFLCLTAPKKYCWGTFRCFRKFLVWKKIRIGVGGYHGFPSKIFFLTVPKNFVEGTFCFRNVLVSKNFLDNWGITII